jgi:hypothetical protein
MVGHDVDSTSLPPGDGPFESDRSRSMRLTNDRYLVTLRAGRGVEHYYRDGAEWIKESTRGRKFKATAEQVLNHLLPALAGVKPGLVVVVEHEDASDSAARMLNRLRTRQ